MTGTETACDDLLDARGVGHAGHAACRADVGRHALERHDRDRARVLGDLRLLGVDDVHDDAALEHLGQAGLDAQGAGDGVIAHEFRSLLEIAGTRRGTPGV